MDNCHRKIFFKLAPNSCDRVYRLEDIYEGNELDPFINRNKLAINSNLIQIVISREINNKVKYYKLTQKQE